LIDIDRGGEACPRIGQDATNNARPTANWAEQRVVGAMLGNRSIPFVILLVIESNVDTISKVEFGMVVGHFLPVTVKPNVRNGQ
jgi:hypothetical protein